MIVCLILLMVFEDSINHFLGFSYLDEILILVIFLLICLRGKIKMLHVDVKILWICMAFYAVGVVSSLINGYQQPMHSLISGIFSIKAFLAYLGLSAYINKKYSPLDLAKQITILGKLSEFLLIVTSGILLLDNFTNVFTINEYRWGIHVSRFVFSHPTALACFGVVLVLCALYYRFSNGLSREYWRNLLPCTIILLISGRIKAIAFFALLCAVLLFYSSNKHALKIRKLVLLIPVVIAVAWKQLIYYFFSDFETSRGVLYRTGIKIANEHFPWGAGFASFGTEYSRLYYSPLYSKYGIDHIWGLSQSYSAFIADAMWPAVIGETGYIGLVLVGILLLLLFKNIWGMQESNKKCKIILMLTWVYLLIESVGDTIFMSARGVCIMFVLALFIRSEQKRYMHVNNERCTARIEM